MRNSFVRFLAITFFVFLLMQLNTSAQFTADKHYAGPSLGFYFHGSSVILGGNYEYGLALKDIGTIGIGGIIRYYTYSAGNWKYTDILIGAQGNYHFKMDNKKFDPWVGLLVALDNGSVSYDGPSGYNFSDPSYGGFWVGLHGGMRYWLSPTMALTGRIGFGSYSYSSFDIGVDFKF